MTSCRICPLKQKLKLKLEKILNQHKIISEILKMLLNALERRLQRALRKRRLIPIQTAKPAAATAATAPVAAKTAEPKKSQRLYYK